MAHKMGNIYNTLTVFLSEIDILDVCKNFYTTHYFFSLNHQKHQFSYKWNIASLSQRWRKYLLPKHYLFNSLNAEDTLCGHIFIFYRYFHSIQEGWFWLWNVTAEPRIAMNIDKFFNPVFNEEYGAIESDSDAEKQADR